MVGLNYLLQESKTRLLQSIANKRVDIHMQRPIISVTFDDVPRSALVNGIPILDKYDVKATYYVAMGLTHLNSNNTAGIDIDLEAYLTPEDILKLHNDEHDIACHTYSHYMLDTGTAEELALDASRNTLALKNLLGEKSIEHFSYPFGQVSFREKKILSNSYKTMRSSRPGINTTSTDMYLLRATSIYSSTFNKNNIEKLLEYAEQSCGWLIFYTHGVSNTPDAYSCTPEHLKWVIQKCSASSAQMLPVSEAYTYIMMGL